MGWYLDFKTWIYVDNRLKRTLEWVSNRLSTCLPIEYIIMKQLYITLYGVAYRQSIINYLYLTLPTPGSDSSIEWKIINYIL